MLDSLASFPFIMNAVVGGLLVIATLSLLSFFVVLRKISFIGVGISHSALGGIAIALALGINLTLTTLVFCIAMAILIGLISRSARLREDPAIGIIFATTMALGVVVASISGVYSSRLFTYLFGTILAITGSDIWVALIVFIVILGLIVGFFKPLLYASFSEDVARVRGIPVKLLHFLLLVMISLATVSAIKLVGVILTSAMLVLPASTAYQVSGRYPRIVAASIGFGLLALMVGLLLSYKFDLPSGPSIVLTSSVIFAIVTLTTRFRKKRRLQWGGNDASELK
ncbi:MAG: metal ABC transporter permease [bacterium]